jgi:hypothetical protein
VPPQDAGPAASLAESLLHVDLEALDLDVLHRFHDAVRVLAVDVDDEASARRKEAASTLKERRRGVGRL